MNKKIQIHVDALFANAGNSGHVLDIKEELLANLNDKYNDLVNSGKSEEEAFAIVVSGVGDISNLIDDVRQTPTYQPLEMERNKVKRALFLSIGIALYILSIIPLLLIDYYTNNSEIGVILMLIICAIATGCVVYGNNVSRVKYSKKGNNFVEEYKEKITVNNEKKSLQSAITSSMWTFIVVIYLAFSFLTDLWSVSWIIFLMGACAQQFIVYKFSNNTNRKRLWHGIMWTATVIIYFIISFAFDIWGWSWLIFLLAAAVEQLVRMLVIWNKVK